MSEQFIGAGWSFPIRIGATGGISLSARDQEIEEAIRLILATAKGERPMRPEFGCGVHDLVFAPINETTAGSISYEVQTSLDRWEPRIDVQDVIVSSYPEDPGVVLIDIRYTIRSTNNPRNLVFPFYVIPESESDL
jgi:phage baseplate assembly protein W